MTENTPSDAMELWRDALTAFHLGKFGHDDQAAAAVIADALAERDAKIARLRTDNEGLLFVLRVVENPDQRMCCDGHECGCMGSTVGQYAAWTYRDEAAKDATIAEQAKQIEALREALIWCSGSNDFNEGGQAREGWLKLCAPLLAHAALGSAKV